MIDPKQIDELAKIAEKQTGKNSDEIKKAFSSDVANAMLRKLKPEDLIKFKELLSDTEKTEKMLSSPQAKLLMKKFLK